MMVEQYLIRKNGAYYRPNRAGYTSSIADAGLYTKEDALAEAKVEKAITAISLVDAIGDLDEAVIRAQAHLNNLLSIRNAAVAESEVSQND